MIVAAEFSKKKSCRHRVLERRPEWQYPQMRQRMRRDIARPRVLKIIRK